MLRWHDRFHHVLDGSAEMLLPGSACQPDWAARQVLHQCWQMRCTGTGFVQLVSLSFYARPRAHGARAPPHQLHAPPHQLHAPHWNSHHAPQRGCLFLLLLLLLQRVPLPTPPALSRCLALLHASLPLHLHASLPLHLHASLPLHLHASLPLHLHASLPLHLHASLPLHLHAPPPLAPPLQKQQCCRHTWQAGPFSSPHHLLTLLTVAAVYRRPPVHPARPVPHVSSRVGRSILPS
ncbi:unnamed protein product [Closterium sp. NIES-54]